jgi:hypothetical protein
MESDEIIPAIIAAAVAAAGPKGANDGAWKAKVNEAIPHIASMVNPASRQWHIAEEVLGASVFVGTYVDHHVEESSTRCVVHIDTGKATKNYPDGIEPIRTHRTDNAQGRSMKERLDRLSAGDELVVWKALESMGDGADANKVRVLVHFETRPKRKDSPGRSPAPASDGRPVESAASASAGSGPRRDDYTDAIDSERIVGWRHATLERLSEAEMGKLNSALAKRGYDFYGVSEVEWVDVVRPLIRSIIESTQ